MIKTLLSTILLLVLSTHVGAFEPASTNSDQNPAVPVRPQTFDQVIRQNNNMPEIWFTCSTTDDCALVMVPCETSFAVNKSHWRDAQKRLCNGAEICADSCITRQPDTSSAVCQSGQCVTVIQNK